MQSKWIIVSIISIISFFAVLSIVLLQDRVQASPSDCKTLKYNGEGKISLLFFSEKDKAEEYSNFLLSTKPFSDYKNSFNIYYLDNYLPECEIYKNKAILCKSKEMIRVAASCPHDYIFVLKSEDKKIRSSAYNNIASINTNHPPSVIIHEFGHTFASLDEEYLTNSLIGKSENCANNCEKFGESCFKECSLGNFYRSVENGVMRSLDSSTYGKFNEQIITEKILKTNTQITGKAIENQESCLSNYYLVEGEISEGKINIKNTELLSGCAPTQGSGEYNYRISSSSTELNGEFDPLTIYTDAPGEQNMEGETFAYSGEFNFAVPAIEGGRDLTINAPDSISQMPLEEPGSRLCRI